MCQCQSCQNVGELEDLDPGAIGCLAPEMPEECERCAGDGPCPNELCPYYIPPGEGLE